VHLSLARRCAVDWLATIVTGLGLLILFAPVLMLLLTFFVLVPLAHLVPHPEMIARTSFVCPSSTKAVDVEFLTSTRSSAPADVVSCSLFADGVVRCKKGCLGFAESLWERRPVVARYALLAGGEAYRG